MNFYLLQMLYSNRTDVSEGADLNKTSGWKEYDIWHYWYFLNFSSNQMSAIDVIIY